jgi:hypothetical protein
MKTVIENIELNEKFEGHFTVSMIFGTGDKLTEKISSMGADSNMTVDASTHREILSAVAKYFRLRGFEVKIRKANQYFYLKIK